MKIDIKIFVLGIILAVSYLIYQYWYISIIIIVVAVCLITYRTDKKKRKTAERSRNIAICIENQRKADERSRNAAIKRMEQLRKVAITREELAIYNAQDLSSVDNLQGKEFEVLCSWILARNGFSRIDTTPDSNDKGVDLIAYKDEIKWAFQCKRYSDKVGNAAVQQVYSGKSVYNAEVAAVITNNCFTKAAIDTALYNKVILWDRKSLQKLVFNANNYILENHKNEVEKNTENTSENSLDNTSDNILENGSEVNLNQYDMKNFYNPALRLPFQMALNVLIAIFIFLLFSIFMSRIFSI